MVRAAGLGIVFLVCRDDRKAAARAENAALLDRARSAAAHSLGISGTHGAQRCNVKRDGAHASGR
jgi:hypothetical protein